MPCGRSRLLSQGDMGSRLLTVSRRAVYSSIDREAFGRQGLSLSNKGRMQNSPKVEVSTHVNKKPELVQISLQMRHSADRAWVQATGYEDRAVRR